MTIGSRITPKLSRESGFAISLVLFILTVETASSVWGFYDSRKGTFLSPINAKRPGKPIDIEDTSPFSAMRLNLNPLEKALFGS